MNPLPPLPPPPAPVEWIYGQDPVTGETSPGPVAGRGAVSVPLNRLGEYLAAYGLTPDRERPGGAVEEVTGLGWTVFVKRISG